MRGGGIATKGNIAVSWQASVKLALPSTAEKTGVGAAIGDNVCAAKLPNDEKALEVELLQATNSERGGRRVG